MSMINPMPFCPSFDPCAKLTPVQVSSSRQRIQNGGGSVPVGASYSLRFLSTALESHSSKAAQTKPTRGDSSSDLPILVACSQSTPLVPERPAINWFAIPTPMIDPISVCELDAGSPSHQVPRFQII